MFGQLKSDRQYMQKKKQFEEISVPAEVGGNAEKAATRELNMNTKRTKTNFI